MRGVKHQILSWGYLMENHDMDNFLGIHASIMCTVACDKNNALIVDFGELPVFGLHFLRLLSLTIMSKLSVHQSTKSF